jgi:hypothetical protein
VTVFLRSATKSPEDEVSPVMPTIAMCVRLLEQRGFDDEPLTLSEGSYAAAESEMADLYRKRGYSGIARAQIPQRNFLLFGVPIIAEGNDG